MGKQIIVQGNRSIRHTDKQQEPPRVPARLEGVVKNAGINTKKKPKKSRRV